MSTQDKNIDIKQLLKWELYGQMTAYGIALIILAVATGVQYKKDHDKKVQHAIEQVNTIKSGATDSINRHVR